MKLKKLVLENFRLFKNLEIDFPDSNVIALIGNNGGGKTSVLDAVSKSISQLLKLYTHRIEDSLHINDVTYGTNSAKVILSFEQDKSDYTIASSLEENKLDVSTTESKYFIREAVPIVVYYRGNRTSVISEKDEQANGIDKKFSSYNNALQNKNSSFSNFENWFINELNIENESRLNDTNFKESPSLRPLRVALNIFIKALEGLAVSDIRIARDEVAFDFNVNNKPFAAIIKKDQKLRFSQLSLGEQSVLYLLCDIARRLTIANSHSEDALQGEGIVLIDELDLHLHPKWQREIVKALTTTFPKVQFIFTTHSPLIISGIRRENLIVLNDGEIIPSKELPNVYSGTADEIIEQIQFAKFTIDEFEEERREIDFLFNKMDFEEAAIKLDALKKKVNANPKWLKDYELRISFAMS